MSRVLFCEVGPGATVCRRFFFDAATWPKKEAVDTYIYT